MYGFEILGAGIIGWHRYVRGGGRSLVQVSAEGRQGVMSARAENDVQELVQYRVEGSLAKPRSTWRARCIGHGRLKGPRIYKVGRVIFVCVVKFGARRIVRASGDVKVDQSRCPKVSC